MKIISCIIKKHSSPDRIIIGKTSNKHPYALIVPYPTTLKVRQLSFSLVNAGKYFL